MLKRNRLCKTVKGYRQSRGKRHCGSTGMIRNPCWQGSLVEPGPSTSRLLMEGCTELQCVSQGSMEQLQRAHKGHLSTSGTKVSKRLVNLQRLESIQLLQHWKTLYTRLMSNITGDRCRRHSGFLTRVILTFHPLQVWCCLVLSLNTGV